MTVLPDLDSQAWESLGLVISDEIAQSGREMLADPGHRQHQGGSEPKAIQEMTTQTEEKRRKVVISGMLIGKVGFPG